MDFYDYRIQRELLGIIEENAGSNIIDYSISSLISIGTAAKAVGLLDTEAARYIRLAERILKYRTDRLLGDLLGCSNWEDSEINIVPQPLKLIKFYFPESMIKVDPEDHDEILGGIKKALNDSEITGISNPLIYSLAAILRSEQELYSSKDAGIESENKKALVRARVLIKDGAYAIFIFIRKALQILEAKLMKNDGFYICKRCGFKMTREDKFDRCIVCGNNFADMCYFPSFDNL